MVASSDKSSEEDGVGSAVMYLNNPNAYILTGWNHNNGVQFEMERRFAKGLAYHFSYDLLNAFASTSCNSGCTISTVT